MVQKTLRDYYKILGVKTKATLKDIKKRYRELARKHHPDTNQGSRASEDRFKIIAEAYETLSDKKKRRAYDRERTQRRRPRGNGYGAPPGYGNYQEPRTDSRYQEPFTQSGFQEEPAYDPHMPTRGFDLQFMVDVPLVTVALGGKIPYTYEKPVNCPQCQGSEESNACPECKGKGWVVRPVTLDVRIPPGVADQYSLRIENQGADGRNGGPPGDLILKICTQAHPRFKRVKNDIYSLISISPRLAEEGGSLQVETLNDVKTIQVEEGTLTGEEYRIEGEGAAILWGKKRGDFVVKFKVSDD